MPDAEQTAEADAKAGVSWFKTWFPIGDHRWYVWIAVAFIAGVAFANLHIL